MRIARVAARTDAGRVRRRNEDAFVCEPPLFAVADGMGGAQAGEIASRLAAAALREYRDADAVDAEGRLRSIIQEANRRIFARATSDPHASGMGTTVTAALFGGGRVSLGHVGDSRAYRLRDGALTQLTEDHSLVADLLRSGRISREEAVSHPQRSVITRALGTDAAVVVDSYSIDAQPGDIFLLCSDGLTTMVDEEIVRQTLIEAGSLDDAAQALVRGANQNGGEDNVTVVLFALDEGDEDDTLSGLEGMRISLPETVPGVPGPDDDDGPVTIVGRPIPRFEPPVPVRPRRVRRALIIALLVLALFAGLAVLALFGLSRAHFVGATGEGRIAVYQGVPWDLVGDVKLYREIYVSRLLTVQLAPQERQELFDHSLVGETEARARIAPYEEEAIP
jgi:serine/threonine protein phosphatase PrpC